MQGQRSPSVSWAMICYVRSAGMRRQAAVEISPRMRSVLASIRRIQSRKEAGYSPSELILGLGQQPEPRREVSRKPGVKRRHS